MKGKKVRLYYILSGLVLACLLLATVIITVDLNSGSKDVIAWVDGEPIGTAEFKHVMLEERSQVYQYFYDKYGATDEEGFWEKSFDGEKPIEKLKTDTWSRLERRKIEQVIALREGVIKSAAYSALKTELEKVNQEREEAVKRKEPVFGPVQYDLRTYYRISLGDMVKAVKSKWLADSPPSEQELSKLYEELKITHFQNPIEARAEYIRIPTEEEAGVRILQDLLVVLQQGSAWKQTVSEWNAAHASKLEYGQRTFDRGSMNEDTISYPSVLRELGGLKTGGRAMLSRSGYSIISFECWIRMLPVISRKMKSSNV